MKKKDNIDCYLIKIQMRFANSNQESVIEILKVTFEKIFIIFQ